MALGDDYTFGSYKEWREEEGLSKPNDVESPNEFEETTPVPEEDFKEEGGVVMRDYAVKKVRGGNVRFKGEEYSKNGKTYDVSEEAYKFLTNLRDGYGRNYFEPA